MIETTQQGDVAIVTMAYGKANALDLEFLAALVGQFKQIETSSARATVLSGQGRMFSAGVDLPRLTAGGADYVKKFLPALHKLYDTVFFHPKPVVAAVNGHAIAGGCVLECCADRRIAARDSGRIGITELLVGVPIPAMAMEVMRFATAPQFFADTVLSGATFPTDVARTRGLIDEIVEPDALMDRALAAANTLSALPPATFAMTKQQLRLDAANRMRDDGPRFDAMAETIWTAPETLAHITDYVTKTFKKS